ncbi:ankyrin-1-like isoform X2 [Trichogramma pretiosum]|uniref:ankyrin-1-like isoform X2 n=1 Tax=Trichogramma pretiosum TaxID=7493 RepID=UPI000C71C4AD|nr:ankyrin-1-like isoform X2 [Trichogramma pretiosum]
MLSNYDDEKRQELDRLNQKKVKRLKKTVANIKWKRKNDRHDFYRRLCPFISDWESPFPNLRDIFNHDQIEWLFMEDVNKSNVSDPDYENVTFVDFAIKAGYIDEFVVIKSGKPVLRRVTPIHHAGRNPKCSREVVDSLFRIYNKFDRNYIDEEFGLTHFQVACMFGCVEAVEKFLELGQDPNQYPMAKPDPAKSIDPPLHLALERKHAKIVELLMKKGADPSLVNVNGMTPVHVVCQKADEDDDDLLELFFKVCDQNHREVQIDARDKLGNTPLHLALIKGKKKVAELLLRKGANANLATKNGYTPLHLIGKYTYDDDLPEMFFKVCDEQQLKVRVDARDKSGNTPLHLALVNGHVKMVERLLRHGASPNLATKDGYTPLFLIFQMNRHQHVSFLDCYKKEMAESLLRHGANPYAIDKDGSTLLHTLSQRSSDNHLVKMFFEICDEVGRPLRVDARDERGDSLLHAATRHHNEKLSELLLSIGADPNSRNKNRETALHIICQRRKYYSAKTFFKICDELHKSVDVDARDISYRTPLSLALTNRDERLVELLLKRGACPNTADDEGSTVLHLFCQREYHVEMARLFFKICDELNLELHVDARDKSHQTPLSLALEHADEYLMESLLRRGADPNLANEEGSTALHFICREKRDKKMAEPFFEICDELNLKLDVDARDGSGRTPLHLAIEHDGWLVESLLRRGGDPNAADGAGSTVLQFIRGGKCWPSIAKLFFKICDELNLKVDVDDRDGRRAPMCPALLCGNAELVELLLRRGGADPNATDKDGSTLLHVLSRDISDSDIYSAKIFFAICDKVGRPLQVDVQDKRGNTPLHLALMHGNGWLVEVLLRRDADPNAADDYGSTPLHIICQGEKDHQSAEMFFEICDELHKSVDVDARDISYRTPLSLTLMYGDEKLVELLLKRGACPNTADDDGSTILHLICQRKYDVEMTKLLFGIADEKNRLVQVDREDKWGRTPLQYAVANLHVVMIAILLDRGADLPNFVFPSADEFERYFEGDTWTQNRDIEFEVLMPLILESLEKRGYRLDRRGASTIIQILAYMSVHAEKYWNLVDYPAIEESSRAADKRDKKYPPRLHTQEEWNRGMECGLPNPFTEKWRNPGSCSRPDSYATTHTKRRRDHTQDAMIRDPWTVYGPPNLYSEEWINPVPWNFYGPPHLCTRSEDNPEPWNFYEPPARTSRFVYRPEELSRSESPDEARPNDPESDSEELADYEEYRAVVAELAAKRHPHEAPRWRGFLLRWAAKSLAELTSRLPESCCEGIVERLTNVDLLNACVAARFAEWRADARTRDRYAFRRLSLSRRQYWQGGSDPEDVRYPPPWRPEAYNRFYGNEISFASIK